MLNLPNKNEINTLPLVSKGNMLGISGYIWVYLSMHNVKEKTKLFAASFMYHLRVENDDDRILKKKFIFNTVFLLF